MTQKPRKGDLRKLKSKTFHWGTCIPRTSLEACVLDALLGNRSVFILDPRMSIPHLLFKENGYKPSGIVWVDKRCLLLVNVCLEYHQPIMTNVCPPKPYQKSLHPKHPYAFDHIYMYFAQYKY